MRKIGKKIRDKEQGTAVKQGIRGIIFAKIQSQYFFSEKIAE